MKVPETLLSEIIEQAVEEATAPIRMERDFLFDALNMHMRSTGITSEAMDRVEAFRAVVRASAPKVRGEFHRLEEGWNKAAKERDAAEREAAALRAQVESLTKERDNARLANGAWAETAAANMARADAADVQIQLLTDALREARRER